MRGRRNVILVLISCNNSDEVFMMIMVVVVVMIRKWDMANVDIHFTIVTHS